MREEERENSKVWYCEKCNLEAPQCDWRYMFSITVVDSSGQSWLTVFSEAVGILSTF
jgi:replication factor A1